MSQLRLERGSPIVSCLAKDFDDKEDYAFLRKEFKKLSKGQDSLTMTQFMRWHELQQLLNDELISIADIRRIWSNHASTTDAINEEKFLAINQGIDDLFELDVDEDEEDEDGDYEEGDSNEYMEDYKDLAQELEGEVMETKSVWDANVDAMQLYDKNFLDNMQEFFTTATKDTDGLMDYGTFAHWEEVTALVEEGSLDVSYLESLWREAVDYQYPALNCDRMAALQEFVNFDTFLRMCYRLDDIVAEIQEALRNLTDGDIEKFYRDEFAKMTDGGPLMTFDVLLRWPFLKETMEMHRVELDIDRLQDLWIALPKKILESGENAIDVDSFIALNTEIEDSFASADISTLPNGDENILQ